MVTNEKIINSSASSDYEVVGGKHHYQKMPNWVKYPQLYDNLIAIKELGLSAEEIGLLYVNFLVEKKPGKIINNCHTNSVRPLKKEIQKDTRDYFSQIKNNLKYDGLKPDEIILNPDLQRLKQELGSYNQKNETIETVVNKLLEDEKGFEKIGDALLSGAEIYKRKKGSIDSPYLFKLFLEYDGILRSLKSKVKLAYSG
jgi:hypothetical protein